MEPFRAADVLEWAVRIQELRCQRQSLAVL